MPGPPPRPHLEESADDTRLDPDALAAFGTDVLQAVGAPEPDFRLVAESLVIAGFWDHPSHGMTNGRSTLAHPSRSR